MNQNLFTSFHSLCHLLDERCTVASSDVERCLDRPSVCPTFDQVRSLDWYSGVLRLSYKAYSRTPSQSLFLRFIFVRHESTSRNCSYLHCNERIRLREACLDSLRCGNEKRSLTIKAEAVLKGFLIWFSFIAITSSSLLLGRPLLTYLLAATESCEFWIYFFRSPSSSTHSLVTTFLAIY